jgi:hypothetical protein
LGRNEAADVIRSTTSCTVVVAAGVVLTTGGAGLATFLLRQSLDNADKISSIISMFVGVAALIIGVWTLRLAVRSPRVDDPAPVPEPRRSSDGDPSERGASKYKVTVNGPTGQIITGNKNKLKGTYYIGDPANHHPSSQSQEESDDGAARPEAPP